jgi:aminoglycoside phosphotransferase
LQAVGQRQKESLLARLTEADKQRQQLEAQLTRAVEQVQARSQAAADAQEKASRQMAVLRQVGGRDVCWFAKHHYDCAVEQVQARSQAAADAQ